MNRTLAIVHVFYPQFWPELASCLRNVEGALDIVITYIDESAVREARCDFPSARFVLVENRGYDLWPFMKVVQEMELSAYDLLIKLHTKRDCDSERIFNGLELRDGAWRRRLLSFCATPEAWRMTLARFADPRVGMVAGRNVIVCRWGVPDERMRSTFDRAKRELEASVGHRIGGGSFVAGTMFAARPSALKVLLMRHFTSMDFPAGHMHDVETAAHCCERMLGIAVRAAGQRLVPFDQGTIAMMLDNRVRMLWQVSKRFFYQRKLTHNGYELVKVCKIPVWRRKVVA